MNTQIKLVLILLALIVFWGGLIWLGFRLTPTERVINCGLSEISPDFTAEMKQQCRKVRT
jgi:hypothetical protein